MNVASPGERAATFARGDLLPIGLSGIGVLLGLCWPIKEATARLRPALALDGSAFAARRQRTRDSQAPWRES